VDVTVTVTNDGSGQGTETVRVTLDEDEDYLRGSDSDTLFIRDNDTSTVYWISTSSTDWNTNANWSTGLKPTAGQEVYFSGSGYASCTNAGSGLTQLAGLHIVSGYAGTVTLANALSVGTYEQTTGILSQPSASEDLTVTGVMLWSGGTLNSSTTSGADVTISGAGTIDPPNASAMSLGSTLTVATGAAITILEGQWEFAGGNGLLVNGQVERKILTHNVTDTWTSVGSDPREIQIGTGASLILSRVSTDRTGTASTALPILNAGGTLMLGRSIHFFVTGRIGADGPSISQTSGTTYLSTGSTFDTSFGMTVSGGDFTIMSNGEKYAENAHVTGNFSFGGTGSLTFSSVWITPIYAQFRVDGDVTWSAGSYKPRVDGDTPGEVNFGYSDVWIATGKFTIGANVTIDPVPVNQGEAVAGNWWTIITGLRGVDGPKPSLPATGWTNFWTEFDQNPVGGKFLNIHR
jgi:hypothetical protein